MGGARTPFSVWSRGKTGAGVRGGALAGLDPFDLGAAALKGALSRAEASPGGIDRLRFGNMYPEGPHGCYGGRYVGHRAGLPETVPAFTLHMSCGTGLHALIEASRDIAGGEADTVAVAGADCPSRQNKEIFLPSFHDLSCGTSIGLATERLAQDRGITREAMDRWSEESHRRAGAAQEDGRLAAEIVPVAGASKDDGILRENIYERIAEAKAMKDGEGLITAKNTHAIVDGGSALILSISKGSSRPLGRVLSWGYAAGRPQDMALASLGAVKRALGTIGARVDDVDLFDINETFAAQLLMDMEGLGLDAQRVNVLGGALALGHPFAATGARQVLGLLLELRRRNLKRGVAAVSVGGGQGVAVAVESL